LDNGQEGQLSLLASSLFMPRFQMMMTFMMTRMPSKNVSIRSSMTCLCPRSHKQRSRIASPK
jgi:hypothetical protein